MKIIICLPDRESHYLKADISFLFIYDTELGDGTCYSLGLADKPKEEVPFISEPVFVFNKRLFDRYFDWDTYDLETQYWLKTNNVFFEWHDYMFYNTLLRFYSEFKRSYFFIPFLKHKEFSRLLINKFLSVPNILELGKDSEFYKNTVFPSVTCIESSGLTINRLLFNSVFEKQYTEDIIYCFYNLYTTTGRPSNTYDHVNFSALKKDDRSRESFISRFEGGQLAEFDFEAYHIRLIAEIIDYQFDTDSIHTYLGRKYFLKDSISDKDYEKSKAITFRLLYGGLTEEYQHIKFFREVESLKEDLWYQYNVKGFIESPFSGRKILKENYNKLNKSKVFNYLLQMIETEFSMIFIRELVTLLEEKKSKLILYTYDSFLLDLHPQEKLSLIDSVTNMDKHLSFKIGNNYKNLREVVV